MRFVVVVGSCLLLVLGGCGAGGTNQSLAGNKFSNSGDDPNAGFPWSYDLPTSGRGYAVPSTGRVNLAVIPVIIHDTVPSDTGYASEKIAWQTAVNSYQLPLSSLQEILFSENLAREHPELLGRAPWGSLTEYFREISNGRLELKGSIISFKNSGAPSVTPIGADDAGKLIEIPLTVPGTTQYNGWFIPSLPNPRLGPAAVAPLVQEALNSIGGSGGFDSSPGNAWDRADQWLGTPEFPEVFDCIALLIIAPNGGVAEGKTLRSPMSGCLVPLSSGTSLKLGSLTMNGMASQCATLNQTIAHEFIHAMHHDDKYSESATNYTIMGTNFGGSAVSEMTSSPYPNKWNDTIISDADFQKDLLLASKTQTNVQSYTHPCILEKYALGWVDLDSNRQDGITGLASLRPSDGHTWPQVINLPRIYSGAGLIVYPDETTNATYLRSPDLGTYSLGSSGKFLLLENRGSDWGTQCERMDRRVPYFNNETGEAPDVERLSMQQGGLLVWIVDLNAPNLQQMYREVPFDIQGASTLDGPTVLTWERYVGLKSQNSYLNPFSGIPQFDSYQLGPIPNVTVRPASEVKSDGSIDVQVGYSDYAQGAVTYPQLLDVLQLDCQPGIFNIDSQIHLRTFFTDSRFSHDHPPTAYVTGTGFTAQYYLVGPGNTETLLATSSNWGNDLLAVVPATQVGQGTKKIRVKLSDTITGAQCQEDETLFVERVYGVGDASGFAFTDGMDNFATGDGNLTAYNGTGESPFRASADHNWTEVLSSWKPVPDPAVYAGLKDALGVPVGYKPLTWNEFRLNGYLKFISQPAAIQVQLTTRYELDQYAADSWFTFGQESQAVAYYSGLTWFGTAPAQLPTGDTLLVQLRKKGSANWTTVKLDNGFLSGRNASWPQTDVVTATLSQAQLNNAGLNNADQAGPNLTEMRVLFLSSKTLQFGGIWIDKVEVK